MNKTIKILSLILFMNITVAKLFGASPKAELAGAAAGAVVGAGQTLWNKMK